MNQKIGIVTQMQMRIDALKEDIKRRDVLIDKQVSQIESQLVRIAADEEYIGALTQALVDVGINPHGRTFREKYFGADAVR